MILNIFLNSVRTRHATIEDAPALGLFSKGLFIAGDCGVAMAKITETGRKHFELALKSGNHLEKMQGPWE